MHSIRTVKYIACRHVQCTHPSARDLRGMRSILCRLHVGMYCARTHLRGVLSTVYSEHLVSISYVHTHLRGMHSTVYSKHLVGIPYVHTHLRGVHNAVYSEHLVSIVSIHTNSLYSK